MDCILGMLISILNGMNWLGKFFSKSRIFGIYDVTINTAQPKCRVKAWYDPHLHPYAF